MDKLDIFRAIAAQATRGELSFPTNVNAALKIKKALDDPDCHIEAAAKLILTDPLLAARTVAVANSAAYNRAGNEITNVRSAVMRLGFRTLHSMVAAVVVREMSGVMSDPGVRAKAQQLWEHTAHVAALSQVIARRVVHLDPDTAMFAALVHEIGGFYVLSRADEYPGLLDGEPEDWIEYGEKIIGRGVLKKLAIPELVTEAVEELWSSSGTLPPKSFGDVLLLANHLSPVASPLQPAARAKSREEAAEIDFEVGGDNLRGILSDAAEEINSLTAALLS